MFIPCWWTFVSKFLLSLVCRVQGALLYLFLCVRVPATLALDPRVYGLSGFVTVAISHG